MLNTRLEWAPDWQAQHGTAPSCGTVVTRTSILIMPIIEMNIVFVPVAGTLIVLSAARGLTSDSAGLFRKRA
jgi:hypothetical protein